MNEMTFKEWRAIHGVEPVDPTSHRGLKWLLKGINKRTWKRWEMYRAYQKYLRQRNKGKLDG